jgi:hypothetical protein
LDLEGASSSANAEVGGADFVQFTHEVHISTKTRDELTERLLHNNLRIFLWAIDNSGRDEISFSLRVLATNRHVPVLLVDVAEEAFYALILHRILNGTEVNTFFMSFAKLEAGGVLDQCVAERLDDLLVDENTFDGKAELDVSAQSVVSSP